MLGALHRSSTVIHKAVPRCGRICTQDGWVLNEAAESPVEGSVGSTQRRCSGPAVYAVRGAAALLLRALLDSRSQFLHLVVDAAPLGHFLADLLVRVHDGGVIAATEVLSDAR